MKKNKLFVMFAVSTLILGSAVPVAKAFADAEDTNTETTEVVSDEPAIPEVIETEDLADEVKVDDNEVEEDFVEETEPITEDTVDEEVNLPPSYEEPVAEEEPKYEYIHGTFEELGLDTKTLYALIAEVEYALNNRHLYAEDLQIPEWEIYDSYGWVVAENSVIAAYAALENSRWINWDEINSLFNNQIYRLSRISRALVLLEDAETPETPEAQYTTVTIELRGKDKGELLDTLTFTNKEVGSELVVEFPHFEGLVTPPNLTITVEEDHQLIVCYQTAPVVTDPDPDGNSDNDGEDDSDNGNDDNGEGTDDNVDPDGGNTGGDTDETVDPDNNDTSGGNVNTGNGNDTDASDNTNDTDNESNDNSSSSDNEIKETSKPKEEAKKSDDSSDKLYTDAEGLAKTSLSSEKSGPAAIGFVGAVIATVGALALFFFREKKTKA